MAYTITITDILNSLNEFGVFAYLLPFLVIFALVFAILEKSRVFGKNKGVHAVLGFAVGMLSLQFDYVTDFFANIFPYAGVGLGVLLVALILMGLISDEDWAKYVWFGLGVVIFLIVAWASLDNFGWNFGRGYNLANIVPLILFLLAIGGFIVWVIKGNGEDEDGGTNERRARV